MLIFYENQEDVTTREILRWFYQSFPLKSQRNPFQKIFSFTQSLLRDTQLREEMVTIWSDGRSR